MSRKKLSHEVKTEYKFIHMRTSVEFKTRIDEASRHEGKTLTGFIFDAVRKELERVEPFTPKHLERGENDKNK